ncbi:MAG: Nudix family hydrolase [Alcanivoracaceae bacterium]
MPSTAPEASRLDVVAAVIRDAGGRVLLARRPDHKHQGGCWEFPGGKVEAGESLDAALARELEEELGLIVDGCRPFMTVDHRYPDLHVCLNFRELTRWHGEPHGREGQPVAWFESAALSSLQFPAANRPVVTALALPDYLLVMPELLPDNWQTRLTDAIGRGCALVYLRGMERNLPQLREAISLCRDHGARSLVCDDVVLMRAVGADGLHLSSVQAARLSTRPDTAWLSVSCHSAAELDRAALLQADMATLSPVLSTPTHPEGAPMGWSQFALLATGRPFAVYALGGLSPQHLDTARACGARGVAGIRAFL